MRWLSSFKSQVASLSVKAKFTWALGLVTLFMVSSPGYPDHWIGAFYIAGTVSIPLVVYFFGMRSRTAVVVTGSVLLVTEVVLWALLAQIKTEEGLGAGMLIIGATAFMLALVVVTSAVDITVLMIKKNRCSQEDLLR